MSFETRYQKLNSEQKKAVDTLDGPVMVVAGPGSGKTELLSLRVANILRQRDVLPSQILCLTFTDAAAKNMQERLFRLSGMEANGVAIHTFHSFALDLIHRFPAAFLTGPVKENADEATQAQIMNNVLETLPLSDPLRMKHPETGGFFYLKETIKKTGALKKAGITPEQYSALLEENSTFYSLASEIVTTLFEPRISRKTIDLVEECMQSLEALVRSEVTPRSLQTPSVAVLMLDSLREAYDRCREENNTKHVTAWKNEWLRRDPDTKSLKFTDVANAATQVSLARVYRLYRDAMKRRGLIDFDDMIIDLLEATETKPGFKQELQDAYRYVLVDEFQDTNDAQMRIIYALTDTEESNILVVGDDDQAIYKFQGSEVENIIRFRKVFPKAVVVELVKNYRSTPAIVDFAQQVVSQGHKRLTNIMKDIEKRLEAANPSIAPGKIVVHEFETMPDEFGYVAEEIRRRKETGESYATMAVISRTHKNLREIAEFLGSRGIPVRYDKRKNVLEEPHIVQLLDLARLVDSIASKHVRYDDSLMPRVLSFPFWELERDQIWRISLKASQPHSGGWIKQMLVDENLRIRDIAIFLLDAASCSHTHSLQDMLSMLVGHKEESKQFSSPLRRYFFTRENTSDSGGYLHFLSALEVLLFGVTRRSKANGPMRLNDFLEYIDIHSRYGIALLDTTVYASASDAVTLLTAHGSKGLEFDTVFVIGCQKHIWMGGRKGSTLPFPKNVRVEPGGDDFDDHMRLFFVALTRAKSHLYATGFRTKTDGKVAAQVPFLHPSVFEGFDHSVSDASDVVLVTQHNIEDSVLPQPLILAEDEKAMLVERVREYRMSASHLNAFLNISKGGPRFFFETCLLRFPSPTSNDALYGTAMHATMERLYRFMRENETLPEVSRAKEIFLGKLESLGMEASVMEKYRDKGNAVWDLYFQNPIDRFALANKIETDFSTQNVVVENARLTGKIDKITPGEKPNTLNVYDFKTGEPSLSWNARNISRQLSLRAYRRQLLFYKLLVENSRDYRLHTVHHGFLEYLNIHEQGIVILGMDMNEEEVERFRRLVGAIFSKITSLDFPDVSAYKPTLEGTLLFEEDLIDGRI